jgi:hypothetical protein
LHAINRLESTPVESRGLDSSRHYFWNWPQHSQGEQIKSRTMEYGTDISQGNSHGHISADACTSKSIEIERDQGTGAGQRQHQHRPVKVCARKTPCALFPEVQARSIKRRRQTPLKNCNRMPLATLLLHFCYTNIYIFCNK